MKKVFAFFALHILIAGSIRAQSVQESLRKDSLELAYKIALLKLQKANADLQKEIDNQPKVDQKAEEAAKKAEALADFNAKIAKVTAQKELLGDAKPTPLTGNLTIDTGTIAMAETRALVYRSLDKLLIGFVRDFTTIKALENSKNCVVPNCDTNSTIVLYHPTYYQAFADYDALLRELARLKRNYEQQTAKIKDLQAQTFVGALALGTQVLNILMSASELFRSETQFKVNDEGIEEDLLASMIRQRDTCCARRYFYPALYLPTNFTASPLMDTLARLDSVRSALVQETIGAVKTWNESSKNLQINLTKSQKGLEKSSADLKKAKEDLKKLTGVARINKEKEIDALTEKLDNLQGSITEDSTDIVGNQNKIKMIETDQKKLDDQYESAMLALRSPVEEGSKLSLLRQFLRVEKLLDVVRKPTTYTLRVLAQGKGTNRIRKFLWATSLKHSAGVETRYQLFNNEAVMVRAAAAHTYTRYRRSRYIQRKLQ